MDSAALKNDHKECEKCGSVYSLKDSVEGACPSCGFRTETSKKIPEMLYRRQDPEGSGPDKGPIGGIMNGSVPMGLMNKRALEKNLTDVNVTKSRTEFAAVHKLVSENADDGFGTGKLTTGPSDGFDVTDTVGFQTKEFAEKLKENSKSVYSFKQNAVQSAARSSAPSPAAPTAKKTVNEDVHNKANANLFAGNYSKGSLEEIKPKGAAQGFGSTGGPNPALMNDAGGNSMN